MDDKTSKITSHRPPQPAAAAPLKRKKGGKESAAIAAALFELLSVGRDQLVQLTSRIETLAAATGTASPHAAAAAVPTLKSTGAPPPTWPSPPSSYPAAPSPALPTPPDNPVLLSEEFANLMSFIANNPDNPNGYIALLQFMTNVESAGSAISPSTLATLMQTMQAASITVNGQTLNFTGLLDFAMSKVAAMAYFTDGGAAGADAFLASIEAMIPAANPPNPNDPFQALRNDAIFYQQNMQQFDSQHSTGNPPTYYWDYNNGVITTRYTWPQDSSMIWTLIMGSNGMFPGSSQGSQPISFNYGDFMREYRENMLNTLLEKFKADPMVAVTLFIMMAYQNQFQFEIQGFGSTLNTLNGASTSIGDLLTDAKNIGAMTPQQAAQFLSQLTDITNQLQLQNGTQPIASNWNQNVYGQIMNTQVTFTNSAGAKVTETIAQVYASGNSSDMASALNSLNPQVTSGSQPPSPNPGYQSLLNALQTAGALTTQVSQGVQFQISSLSNTIQQLLGVMGNATSQQGGGFTTLFNALVQNQISR